MSCECCEQWYAAPLLRFKSVGISKAICGFPGFTSVPSKFYLTRQTNLRMECGENHENIGTSWEHESWHPLSAEHPFCTVALWTGGRNPDPFGEEFTACNMCDGPHGSDTTDDYSHCVWDHGYWETQLSDLYPWANFVDDVKSLLPDFPEEWEQEGTAFLDTDNYSSISFRRVKAQIQHPASASCYLKVWLRKRVSQENAEDDVLTPFEYEWIGTDDPCGNGDGVEMITHDLEDLTESEFTKNGTATYEIVKWSYLQGYEPPDDGSANGFPKP